MAQQTIFKCVHSVLFFFSSLILVHFCLNKCGFLFLDAPVFAVASNSTLNYFIKTGENASLNCSVSLSNPPVKNIKFSNNSKYTKNIKVHDMYICL